MVLQACYRDGFTSVYIVTCWVYVTRQITSRLIAYSEFIPHSLLQIHNLQSHNYCHQQYHNYVFCRHCRALDATQLVAAVLHFILDPGSILTHS
jgi:hypothetical protein